MCKLHSLQIALSVIFYSTRDGMVIRGEETHDLILIVDVPYHMREVTLINYRRSCMEDLLGVVPHMPKAHSV